MTDKKETVFERLHKLGTMNTGSEPMICQMAEALASEF